MVRSAAISRLYASVAVIGLALALGVQTTGCSLLGLAGGAMIDAATPRTQLMPTGKLYAFRLGDSLVLELHDGSKIPGRYAGYLRFDDSTYRARLETFAHAHPELDLPLPGEPLCVDRSQPMLGGRSSGQFVAFLHDAIEIRNRRGVVESLRFRDIARICREGSGPCLSHRDLESLRLSGGLPLAQSLALDTADGPVEVPLDEVAVVEGPAMRDAARKGFVLGLAADAIIVVTVVAVAANMRGPFEGADCNATPTGLYSWRVEARADRVLAAVRASAGDRS